MSTINFSKEISPMVDHDWKNLYRIGGVAALLAVFIFRRFLGAELSLLSGMGVPGIPATTPVSAAEWLSVIHSSPLVGLTFSGFFDLVEYSLVGLVFLAAAAALWRTSRTAILLAIICGLMGITLAFAANQSFALIALSERFAVATTDMERAALLSNGEALLAVGNPGATLQGTSTIASLFFVLVAGLLISLVMLRSQIFSRFTAIAGIVANCSALVYFPMILLMPSLLAIPFVFSAPFRLLWYFLTALTLFRLGKKD
jgi:hypothetical protein